MEQEKMKARIDETMQNLTVSARNAVIVWKKFNQQLAIATAKFGEAAEIMTELHRLLEEETDERS